MADIDAQIRAIESAIRCDPARRGLLAQPAATPLGPGELAAAARDLAEHGRDIAIVTGFAIPTPDGPRPETDGPHGAALLADLCRHLGMRVRLVTDEIARSAVAVAAQYIGFPESDVACCPLNHATAADWCDTFLRTNDTLTHLIAIERPGPNHTADSLRALAGQAACDQFCSLVPPADRNACHNMRGENIDRHTAPLHLLFEGAKVQKCEGDKVRRSEPQHSLHSSDYSHSSHFARRTIGIGDGGNEIGMGRFPWQTLHPLIAGGQGPKIACRIGTDWTIIAGTSNWGAFALAAAVALLRNRPDLLEPWTVDRHRELLESLVADGAAVDGVTRERTATVDGLPFLTYLQPWEAIRTIVAPRPPD